MLNITTLGSGSSGNSALVCSGRTRLLVDAGLSAKQLRLRLEAIGVDPESLDGILLTHEHGDHTRGIDVFCRKVEVPVFCTARTRMVLRDSMKTEKSWKVIPSGGEFEIGDLGMRSFPVAHDAVDPVGFVVRDGESSLGIVSDVGFVTSLVVEAVRGVNTLFVEANYDEQLLFDDTKRPPSIKQRISSRHGHLSNEQTAELVVGAAGDALQRVILGHLSSDCNTPEIARRVVGGALGEALGREVEVVCAAAGVPTGGFDVCAAPVPVPVVQVKGEVVVSERTVVREEAVELYQAELF